MDAARDRREAAQLRAQLEAAPPEVLREPEPHFVDSQTERSVPAFLEEPDPDEELLAALDAEIAESERELERLTRRAPRETLELEEQREEAAFADRMADRIADRLEDLRYG